MPVPSTLTSYLPVLLVSVSNNAVPDDSTLSTLPQSQVDYLSHEWREEDVWRSWRSMTRQKNAIANGMRLENASWRTWWKQRNKLKTISPETLNWLKDSDVTWLYGPLVVGSDWSDTETKEKLEASGLCRGGSDSSDRHQLSTPNPAGTKPILKRRSISQLLSLPASPFFDQDTSDTEESEAEHLDDPSRPPLLHTKSDTHISWRSRPHRRDSPPRIIAAEAPTIPKSVLSTASSESSNSAGSDQDLSASSGADGHGTDSTGGTGKKKHISFNTFVEQCIAIEKPKPKRKSFSGGRHRFFENTHYDDGYDEDSEVGYDDESDEPSSFFLDERSELVSDSDDDDDDVLEMRTSSSRSRSSSSSRSRHASFTSSRFSGPMRNRPTLFRTSSVDRDRVTIAPIAPTMLKTAGVGNDLTVIGEEPVNPQPKEVDLVYVPPSNYSLPGTPNLIGGNDDLYRQHDSFFGINPQHRRALSAGSSPMINEEELREKLAPHDPSKNILSSNLQSYFGPGRIVDSPMNMHTGDAAESSRDAYDYFGGPDLGEDYAERRSHSGRRKRSLSDDMERDDDDLGASGPVRYSHPGPSSAILGRSNSFSGQTSPWYSYSSTTLPRNSSVQGSTSQIPSVIINEVSGSIEERSEDFQMSTSPTAFEIATPSSSTTTPVPATPIAIKNSPKLETVESLGHPFSHVTPSSAPISRLGTSLPNVVPVRQDSDPSFLSPTDSNIPTRGRLPHCSSSSHSGSTTTGSYSRSSDSRSESRGRSSTRTSSYSDHERSGSRSSRGTNSPLGSISPTGSTVAIGTSRGRESGSRIYYPVTGGGRSHKSSREDGDRGRDRTGRRLENSMSPPHAIGSPARVSSDIETYQPYTPELLGASLEKHASSVSSSGSTSHPSPPSSVAGSTTTTASDSSSTASSSTVVPGKTAPQPNDDSDVIVMRSRSHNPPKTSIFVPSPIPEEEELRSKQSTPTPASPPSHSFRLVPNVLQSGVTSPNHSITPPKARISQPVTSPSEATAISPPTSPTGFHADRSLRGSIDGLPPHSPTQQQAGTLAGRAADLVSSARGFLGSIWNTNQSAAPTMS
ncbi:hypothetical protein C8Q75DRAFT_195557 [Abortiporus biennis]|nr:hypothetical protein C8Q75DRAFT_195557 [Abortiporus biennis]